VPGDELRDLTADLQVRHVRVEQQPIDALDLQRDALVRDEPS